MTTQRKYLTPDQLVDRLEGAVTVGTLANWRARKPNPGPPYTKVGGRVRYPLEQVEAWEQRNTHNQPANDNAEGAGK